MFVSGHNFSLLVNSTEICCRRIVIEGKASRIQKNKREAFFLTNNSSKGEILAPLKSMGKLILIFMKPGIHPKVLTVTAGEQTGGKHCEAEKDYKN